MSQAGENQITVTTESGETQVNLGDDLAVQAYSPGEVGDISAGDRVLVITADDNESGNPVTTTSVIVNPPEGGGSSEVAAEGLVAGVNGPRDRPVSNSGLFL